jgi:hypothetical protein
MNQAEDQSKISRREIIKNLSYALLSGAFAGSFAGFMGNTLGLKLEQFLEQKELEYLSQYRDIIYKLDENKLLQHSEKLLSSNRMTKIDILKLSLILKRLEELETSNNGDNKIKFQIRSIRDLLQNYLSS